jgi:alkanesulfonate monooxygenase SsuD/methylene tetrahydromethanopterin reductase-like flavin-dependent oxidoreductase (luciferase family)
MTVRFGIIQEPFRATPERYADMLEEAELADELGFDSYGVSELHFLGRGVSAPEVMLGAVAARTKRMKVRFLSIVLAAYNHPIRVAEAIATLDSLTGGRAEAATARSQHLMTLEGFGIDPAQTRAQWAESLEIIIKALTQESFEHEGTFWSIPSRSLTPRPLQTPHPPLMASATSLETHRLAGEKGMGVISGNSLVGGWAYLEAAIALYNESLANGSPITTVNNGFAVAALVAHCAPTDEQARAEAGPRIQAFLDQTIKRRSAIAPTSADYAYQIEGFDEIERRRDDLDHLIDRAPYFTVGSPEFIVERCRRLESMGVSEIVLEIEGLDHEQHMRSIELIGKHVIPQLRS